MRRPAYSLVTAPTAEPVSVLEACSHIRDVPESELLLLQGYLGAAREYIEGQTGRALMAQTWKRTSATFEDYSEDSTGRTILLERTPLASVTHVKYYDASDVLQTLSASAYYVLTVSTPGRICLKDGEKWPTTSNRPDAVEITFTAGASSASAVPPTLRHAILLLASHLYEQRQPVNIGNISSLIPGPGLQAMIESNRVGGWVS